MSDLRQEVADIINSTLQQGPGYGLHVTSEGEVITTFYRKQFTGSDEILQLLKRIQHIEELIWEIYNDSEYE